MKLLKLTLSAFLLSMVTNAFSQSNSVFIIIDETAENIEQLATEYSNQANVYFADGSSLSAIDHFSDSEKNIQIGELHIYAATKPGAIVFSSMAITMSNESDWSTYLKEWAGVVSSQVIIHSDVVFSGEEGIQLKQGLEEISGLLFTTQH